MIFELACCALLAVQDADALRPHLKAIREAAEAQNKKKGDAFFEACVAAAVGSVDGSTDRAAGMKRALLALGTFFDDGDLLLKNPLTAKTFRGLESKEERSARKKLAAGATLRGREDLARHFSVFAALSLLPGKDVASRLGVAKEWADARAKGRGDGTGFSFADLCANEAGILFAERAVARELPKRISVVAFMPQIDDLPEGLTDAEFEETYGGTGDVRFKKALESIRRQIRGCKGHRK